MTMPIDTVHQRHLSRGTIVLSGMFGPGRAVDYEETRGWSRELIWTPSPQHLDAFAVAHHYIFAMRARYPFIMLYVSSLPPVREDLGVPRRAFERHTFVRLGTRYVFMLSGNFRLSESQEQIDTYLFDIERNDFTEFAGLVDERTRFSAAFLFSESHNDIRIVGELFERKQTANALRRNVLRLFQVIFLMDDEDQFVLLTKDARLIQTFMGA